MESSRIDLNLLRFFVAVAEHRSFTKAAERLATQRSTVSRGVAALENALGVQLFLRSTRSVSLTSAGEALREEVGGTLASLIHALERVPEREDAPSGMLRITAPHDLGSTILPQALAELRRRHPALHVEVRLTSRLVNLVAEGVDVALRPGRERLPDSLLRARRLTTASAGIYASPTYLARAGTPRDLSEALEHAWVGGPVGVFDAPNPAMTGDDMLFVRSALLAHVGLGLLPAFLAQEELITGRLVALEGFPAMPRFSLYFLTPPAAHVPRKVQALRDYLLAYFRLHPLP